jgi:predicted DCC family thiol-disulfide oxidoreductase YuxK
MESGKRNRTEYPVLLFDGFCNLCSASVIFILKRERKNNFYFASLQSDFAKRTLREHNLTSQVPDSIVLIEDGKTYFQSTAALRVTRYLKWPWPLLYGFIILPRFLRDPVYNLIARKRYSWFGKRETCFMPDKDVKNKFLDQEA